MNEHAAHCYDRLVRRRLPAYPASGLNIPSGITGSYLYGPTTSPTAVILHVSSGYSQYASASEYRQPEPLLPILRLSDHPLTDCTASPGIASPHHTIRAVAL